MFSKLESPLQRRAGLGLLFLFLLASSVLHAQNPFDAFQHFSAKVSGSPLRWNKRQIYRSGDLWRAEYTAEDEIRFSDRKQRNGWYVRPLQGAPRECGRMTLLDASSYAFFTYSGGDINVEPVPAAPSPAEEKETIDGHPCTARNYLAKTKDGGITIKVKLWEAEDLKGFPVKMEIEPQGRNKFTISYSDVSLEPPDPKLFVRPAICHAGASRKKKTPASSKKPPAKKTP
jgi:hypothetical protein